MQKTNRLERRGDLAEIRVPKEIREGPEIDLMAHQLVRKRNNWALLDHRVLEEGVTKPFCNELILQNCRN